MEATKALQRVKEIFYQLCTAVTGTSTTIVTDAKRTGGKGKKGGKNTAGEAKSGQNPTMVDVRSFAENQRLQERQMDNVISQPMADGDAVYCEDAFTNILAAGIRPDLSMYKAMLKVLCYEAQLPVVVVREGGMAADRAMQVFRQMRIEIKGVDTNPSNNTSITSNSSSSSSSITTNSSSSSSGNSKSGIHKSIAPLLAPDQECYELIIRTFEGCMLSLGSASTRQVCSHTLLCTYVLMSLDMSSLTHPFTHVRICHTHLL